MKIAISGASGMVGTALRKRREELGDTVIALKRDPEESRGGNGIFWSADLGLIDEVGLEGLDAVIHLAGENLVSGPWTERRKEAIRESRVRGTLLVAGALSHLENPPKVLLIASAVGFYGDRGEEILTEESASGEGFLAEVCREWEEAGDIAREAGIRVVHLRFGVILDREKGMLGRLLPIFRSGLGGRAGRGDQYISWVALPDLVEAVGFCLENEKISGPVNVASPNSVTNKEFSKILAKTLHRPAAVSVPAAVLKLATGQLAQEVILASTRAMPKRLEENGFVFKYPELESALRFILDREK